MLNISQDKWVIIVEEDYILTRKGFKRINKVVNDEVRTFAYESLAKEYLSTSPYANCKEVVYKRVKVLITEE